MESDELLELKELKTRYKTFIEIAELWTILTGLFAGISETKKMFSKPPKF